MVNRRPAIDISIILIAWIVASVHVISPNFIPSKKLLDDLHEKDWKTVVSTLKRTFSSKPEDLYLYIYTKFMRTRNMPYLFLIGGMNSFFSLIRYNIKNQKTLDFRYILTYD